MLSTANDTQVRPLTDTMTLGSFVVAATIGQVGTIDSVSKTRCLVQQTKNESHTPKTYPSYRQLAKGRGVGKQNFTRNDSRDQSDQSRPVRK